MRILWVKVGGLWPLNTGGRLRSFHTIAQLARRHRVTVLTTHGPADAPEGLDAQLADCEQVVSIPYAVPGHDSARFARPTVIRPKQAQSTCACSPGSVQRRRNASLVETGRTLRTYLRSWTTEPG